MQRFFLQKAHQSGSLSSRTLSLASRLLRRQHLSEQNANEKRVLNKESVLTQAYQKMRGDNIYQPSLQHSSNILYNIQTTLSRQSNIMASYLSQSRLNMQKNEEEKGDDKKIPKGFEKFFKKKQEGEKKEKAQPQEKEHEKEQKKSEEKEEERMSEEEDKSSKKKDEKKEEEEKSEGGSTNYLKNFFIQPNGQPNWENLIVGLLLTGSIVFYFNSKKPSQEITYMEFVNQYLSKNQVKMITITEDKNSEMFKYKAEIETQDGNNVHLVLPSVENFLFKLDQAQREMGKVPNEFVPVKYASEASLSQGNVTFNYMVGGLFLILLLQIYKSINAGKGGPKGTGKGISGGQGGAGGPGGFGGRGGLGDIFGMGKSNVQIYGVDKKIKTKFKHVAGMETAKIEVQEFVDFLKDPKKYQKLGAQIPRGALLVGPPGTGKTLLAKAVAGEAGVPFLSISGSDFVEMFVGVGASRVRDLFKKARERAPSIIFVDEIDAVAKKRHGKFGGSNDERDNTLNQLLVEMDGFSTEESVIVLAATNRVDILDTALLRPGRFDRQIEITLPTIKDRSEIFKVHLKKIKLNPEKTREDYAKKLSTLTPGFSGADISNACNEGAIIAARNSLDSVGIKEFEQAIERVLGGIEKKTIITPEERRTIAYHESGHAVAGWFLEHSNPLLKITIIPRSKGSLGFTQYLPDEISLYTRDQILDMICTALGGRVTEEIMFNKITTGAQDDIKKVTQLASGLVTVYGMSEKMGLVGYNSANEEQMVKPYSEETNEHIDEEIRAIVQQQYERVKKLLTEKKHLIEALAEELLAKESVGLPDIFRILGDRPYPLKESVREYLEELKERKVKEDKTTTATKPDDKKESTETLQKSMDQKVKEDEKSNEQ